MRIWLPYIVGGSGTDTFTETFSRLLRQAGHHTIVQPFGHHFQYAPDLLRRIENPNGTDIIFTNSWAGFAFKRSGIPMVTMEQLFVHDPAYAPYRSYPQAVFHRTLVRWFEARTFRAADRVVAVSESTREAMRSVYPRIDPVVIHNGVDTQFFTPRRGEKTVRSDPFRVLFIGNLTPRKGADLLPSIMAELGQGFELRYTSGLRTHTGLDIPNAHNLGRLDREGVRRAMWDSDVFLFPTRLEGLPLSVLEAMACGLPVVGSNASSMPETVQHGTTGLLCDLNPTELAEAVKEVADDAQLRQQMGSAGRARAESLFSMNETVSRYLELFETLLS